jgi:hypothetical protein
MRDAGFLNQACGPDGPEARARAQELNAQWDERERTRKARPKLHRGFIYFLRSGERIKIGFSERLSLRGIDNEAGRGFPVHQLVVFRGSRSEEIRLHQRLKSDLKEDGWYTASPALCAAMLRAAGPPDLSND